MVYFTCNHCGESLKKASVEKHYFGPCQRPKFLTCVDCIKDFRGEEYNGHTKCITEDEKYSAKGFSSRSPSVKGEVKQLSWLELIQYVIKSHSDIPAEQVLLLNKLCNHNNVPQKRPKFHNFVKNISARTHRAVVDEVWNLLETEKCARKEKEAKTAENGMENGSTQNGPAEVELDDHDTSKKKKKKKKKSQEVVLSDNEQCSEDNVSSKDKQKKKPVNNADSTMEMESDDVSSAKWSKSKKKRKHEEQLPFCGDASVKKKNKLAREHDTLEPEEVKTDKFDWSKTIVKVLESAENNELSVKRLRKKVISEFSSSTGAEIDHSVLAKFTKKLAKIPIVLVMKDKAKLKHQN